MDPNPHDKFFKQVFTKRELARRFFQAFLPPEVLQHLDLSKLRVEKQGFVDQKLDETFSDLLYRVAWKDGEGFVYLLMEHKSHPAPMVRFQILGYMVRVWEQYMKQHKNARTLPVIVPMVLYHGANRWQVPDMRSLFGDAPEALLGFVPEFQVLVDDPGEVPDKELACLRGIGPNLLVMKHIHNGQDLIRVLYLIAQDLKKSGKIELDKSSFESLVTYLFLAGKDLDKQDLASAASDVLDAMGGRIMGTLAEKYFQEGLQEGEHRGVEKGRTQGIVEGLRTAVVDLLVVRYGDEGAALAPAVQDLDIDTLQTVLRIAAREGVPIDQVREILEV